jgi:uncharacterized protein YxeA
MKTALLSITFVLLISSAAFGQGAGQTVEQRQQNMIDQSNEYLLKQQQSQEIQQQQQQQLMDQKKQRLQYPQRPPLQQIPQQMPYTR